MGKRIFTLARLVIYEDAEDEETIFEVFDLTINRVLVGSSGDNELVLEAPAIDPAHASLELRHNRWILQDLGGPGGTVVNGNVIEGPYYLQNNDLIELGPVKMKFQEHEHDPVDTAELSAQTAADASAPMSGRVWFATIAGGTIAIIFIILFLLVVADYLGLLEIADLLPPWLG